jgi:hypothetical protein
VKLLDEHVLSLRFCPHLAARILYPKPLLSILYSLSALALISKPQRCTANASKRAAEAIGEQAMDEHRATDGTLVAPSKVESGQILLKGIRLEV